MTPIQEDLVKIKGMYNSSEFQDLVMNKESLQFLDEAIPLLPTFRLTCTETKGVLDLVDNTSKIYGILDIEEKLLSIFIIPPNFTQPTDIIKQRHSFQNGIEVANLLLVAIKANKYATN